MLDIKVIKEQLPKHLVVQESGGEFSIRDIKSTSEPAKVYEADKYSSESELVARISRDFLMES